MNLTYFQPIPRRRLALLAGILLLAAAGPVPAVPKVAPAERRILVIGDSQAQGLAAGLIRLYLRHPEIHVLDHSKIGTGLARMVFDWPGQTGPIAAANPADLVVVMFGANDRPTIRRHGKIDAALADSFTKTYGGRVDAVIAALRAAKLPVIWVGHPQVRDPEYNEDMKFLNGIFETEAKKDGADFVPIWDLFAGEDGGYDAYGKGLEGATERLRADDGVHMSRAGYDVLAHFLQTKLDAALAVKK